MSSKEFLTEIGPEANKERLPDEELGNLLAAIGNSEAKAITLIIMETGEIYPANRLHKKMMHQQGLSPAWKTAPMTPFNYCRESLAPIGLVTEEALNEDTSVYGFIRTDYGEKVGVPLAGILLGFSEKHPETSLYQLFGKTNSSAKPREIPTQLGEMVEYRKRAPMLRLQIFRLLAASPDRPVKQVEITDRLVVGSARTKENLNELARNGLITYASIGPDKSYTYFKVTQKIDDAQETPGHERSLSQAVLKILKQKVDEELTSEAVANLLVQNDPKWEGLKAKKFRDRINSVLGTYTKQGILERGKYQKGKKSEISLNEYQKGLIKDIVALLDDFQRQDSNTIALGEKLADEIISDPIRVSKLMTKAKENSRGFAAVSFGETSRQIVTILATNPGSTNQQIGKQLELLYARKISRKRIAQVLLEMEKSGKVIPETRHSTKYWSVKNR